MQIKRLMGSSGGKSALQVQSVHHTTMYSNIPAAPQVFYMSHTAPSRRASLAPPPSGLQSLATTLYNNESSTESEIQQYMDAVTSEEETVAQPSGLLGVIRDLQAYEDFLREEMEMSDDPTDPDGLRGLQGGVYRLERDSSAHVAGILIRKLIDYWKQYYFRLNSSVTFTEFLLQISEQDLKLVWGTQDSYGTAEVIRRFKQGVRYLGDEKREKYRVTSTVSGKLYWEKWGNSKPLDTVDADFYKRKHDHLGFTSDNIAIWVLSSDDRLYTHAAKVHRFHHSSFVNGNAVKCAGDWEVKDGKLIWISPASGHYKPTFDNLHNAIQVLANKFGIQATSYKVKVFEWETASKKIPVLIPASSILFDLAAVKNKYSPAP
ncbi:MAG: hypothetical protein JNL58_19965 [Planctomyces sp.]|nr:hypothetical protein [Planctomyces sp.]